MNTNKLHRFVECIYSHRKSAFESVDTIEDIEAVIFYLCQHPELDAVDRHELLHSFYPIASEAELTEIAQLAV